MTSSPAHRSTAAIPVQEDASEPAVLPAPKRARREAAAAAKQKRAVPLPEHSAAPVAAHTRRSTPPPVTAASLSKTAVLATSAGHAANGAPAAASSSGVKRVKMPQASLAKQKSPPPWAGMTAAALAQEQQRQQWQVAALLPGDFAAPLVPAVALPRADALITSPFSLGGITQQPLLALQKPVTHEQDGAQATGVAATVQAEQSSPPCVQPQPACQPPDEHTHAAVVQNLAGTLPDADSAVMGFMSGNTDAPPGPVPQQQPAQSPMRGGAAAQTSAAQSQATGVQPAAAEPAAGRPAQGMTIGHGPTADGVTRHDAEQTSRPGAGSDVAQGAAAEEQPTAPARPADSSAVRKPEQPSAGHAAVKATYANGHATTEYALERPRRDVRAPNRMPVGPVDAHQVLDWAVGLVMFACAAP